LGEVSVWQGAAKRLSILNAAHRWTRCARPEDLMADGGLMKEFSLNNPIRRPRGRIGDPAGNPPRFNGARP